MISIEQENELFKNGFVELPQITYDDSLDNFKNLTKDLDKTYNSDTAFHKKYLEKHNIKTDLRDKLVELSNKHLGIDPQRDDIYTISRIVYSFDNF